MPKSAEWNLLDMCNRIKKYDFNLRLSINLNNTYNSYDAEDIFKLSSERYGADQITFRVMYTSDMSTPQDKWIEEYMVSDELMNGIRKYITNSGREIGRLEYGQIKYSVNGMTTVLDSDCMSQEVKEEMKYLILRPDCKLYSRWEDKASLIF